MPQDIQPEFELPAILRLPQVPPLKVPVRRQSQFMACPTPVRSTEQVPTTPSLAPMRYTEQVPVTPSLAPENDLFMPVPITPPLTHRPQEWMRTPYPANHSITGMPMPGFVPTGRRSRDVGNGEFLLGCAFLILMALLALGLLTWLSSAR